MQVFDNNVLYKVKEIFNYKVIDIKYLVFENGDIERCDKKYGQKRQYELLNIIKNEAELLLCENDQESSFSKILVPKKNELVICLKNSTLRIHVITNSELMGQNQVRKEMKETRCLPFLKEMDKFTTLYIYATVDYNEPVKNEYIERYNKITGWMMEDFESDFSDLNPKYLPVEYIGYIQVEEEDING